MKKILGLDLGTASIGWALVNEAQNKNETSEILKLGVRVNPLSVDLVNPHVKIQFIHVFILINRCSSVGFASFEINSQPDR